MPGTREIKRRIKSISSTKKITRAMQMISAVKMRKAQNAALSARTYAGLAWEIVTNLAHRIDPEHHRLLKVNTDSKKIGVLLVTTNRGMVGSLNTSLITAVNARLAKERGDVEVISEIFSMGKKGRDQMLRLGKVLVAEFVKPDRVINISEILPLARLVTQEYMKGTYRKIFIAYTHFNSTMNQKPEIIQLLPLAREKADAVHDLPSTFKKNNYEYLFEPDPQAVLDYMLPRIIESQVYQAVLENDASEHSARMVMMKNATDAASDLIDDLTLAFNQLRQANITKELAEIIAGMGK